jgi:hypothetical protein
MSDKQVSPAAYLKAQAQHVLREATALTTLLDSRPLPAHLGEAFGIHARLCAECLVEIRSAIVNSRNRTAKVRW